MGGRSSLELASTERLHRRLAEVARELEAPDWVVSRVDMVRVWVLEARRRA